jgi:hypothetical protein
LFPSGSTQIFLLSQEEKYCKSYILFAGFESSTCTPLKYTYFLSNCTCLIGLHIYLLELQISCCKTINQQ